MKLKEIIGVVEELAPPELALEGDPVGLQVGDPEREIRQVAVALDPDRNTIKKALTAGADLLITHHPLFFNALDRVVLSEPQAALVADIISSGLAVYSAHTNFDIAPFGVSYQLALVLGLPVSEAEVLEVTGREELLKLVVYVPSGYEDQVRDALAGAGAGEIGRYSHCTFQVAGTGTFKPGMDTDPFLGKQGQLEKVEEYRLETILPAALKGPVVKALLAAHPYEETAYDLYRLDLKGRAFGLGLLINFEQALPARELVEKCRTVLPFCTPRLQLFGRDSFNKVALSGGSGASLINRAALQGADVLLAGDFKYHDLQLAQSLGLSLIDAGHAQTELPAVDYLACELARRLGEQTKAVQVCKLSAEPVKWDYI